MAALLLVSLACNFGSAPAATPTSTIPVSTEEAGKFLDQFNQAIQQAQKGETINVSFTEAEITSYLALRLQDQPGLDLSNVQVYLRDGKVQVFASYVKGLLSLPLRVVFVPKISSDGNVSLELESMKMGAVAIPDSLKNEVTQQANNAFAQLLSDSGKSLYVESLTILDGSLNLSGKLR